MPTPEQIIQFRCHCAKELVFRSRSPSPWQVTREHHEKNHPSRKQICFLSVISRTRKNLGCHILLSSLPSINFASSCRSCATKVGNLQIVFFVQKNVFRFHIKMADVLAMDVLESRDQESEVCPTDDLWESSLFSDNIE